MSKLDTLLEFYKQQLNDLMLTVEDEMGRVSFPGKESELKPVTVGGDRLCIPTKTLLQEGDYSGCVIYHPLSEQFSTSLSPILNALKGYIARTHTVACMSAILGISNLIATPAAHKNLGAKAGEWIKDIGQVDDKLKKSISDILTKVGDAPEKRLVNVLLKSSDDQKTLRTCIITYPILEAIIEAHETDTREILGVTVRKGDLPILRELFTKVCGDKVITTSKDKTAPFYEALLLAWREVATHYNGIHKLFKSKVSVIEEVGSYELEWSETLDDFTAFADKHNPVVPLLPGNRPRVEDLPSRETVFEDKLPEERETSPSPKPQSRLTREVEESPGGVKQLSINDYGNRRASERSFRERDVSPTRSRFTETPRYERDTPRRPQTRRLSINDY